MQVVEEGGAGMAKTLALGKRFGGGAAVPVSRPPPPTLPQLFAQTSPQAESSEEIARISDDEDTDAADFQSRPGGSPIGKRWDSANRSPQNAFASISGEPFASVTTSHTLWPKGADYWIGGLNDITHTQGMRAIRFEQTQGVLCPADTLKLSFHQQWTSATSPPTSTALMA